MSCKFCYWLTKAAKRAPGAEESSSCAEGVPARVAQRKKLSSELQNHRTEVENKMNQGLLLIKALIGMEAFGDYLQPLEIHDNKQISKQRL